MKTPFEIFKNKPELLNLPEVKKLLLEYEIVCDALIDLQQTSEYSKETHLKVLVSEIRESISTELNHDMEAERFGETERVDFKKAMENLQTYIFKYCKDFNINI